MTGPVVLVIGDYRQTLAVVRALAAHGCSVVAGVADTGPSHVRWSRYPDARWIHPVVGEEFLEPFLEALDRFRPDVVFPVGDREIAWIARHRDRLPDVALAAADPEITDECQDKVALMQRAADLGVPHSPFRVVGSLEQLTARAEELGYPVFVKPHDPLLRLHGEKGIAAESAAALNIRFSEWPEGHRLLIVQRLADGPRHNVYFAARRGEVLGAVQVAIDRTDRLDGTGLAVDGVVVDLAPALASATETLAGALGYTGVGCTQFLVGDRGISFLELNPRLGANYAVAHHAGLDLAAIAVDLALDREIESHELRTGIRYAWTLGDVEGLKEAVRDRRAPVGRTLRWIADILRTAWRADAHVTWRSDDPAPTLVLAYRSLLRPLVRRAAATVSARRA